ncbi:MAG: hypothetical protein ABIQ60_12695 [Burkholderiaceae bacterium]
MSDNPIEATSQTRGATCAPVLAPRLGRLGAEPWVAARVATGTVLVLAEF